MSNDCDDCKYEKLKLSEEPCRSCSCCEDENNNWSPKEEEEINKNYVREFMEDNKLEINVEFPVKSYDEMFYFDDEFNLKDRRKGSRIALLFDLLTGISEIAALPPFSPTNLPEQGEKYWSVEIKGTVPNFFVFNAYQFALVASGNAFHSREEAEANAPRIRKEQGMIKS